MINSQTVSTEKNKSTRQAIGPLPVAGPENAREQERVEDVEVPLKVDMKNPRLHKLAKHIGWKRVFEIAQEERQAIDEAREL